MFYKKYNKKYKTNFFCAVFVLVLLFTTIFESMPVLGISNVTEVEASEDTGTEQLFKTTKRTTDFNEGWRFQLEATGNPQEITYDDSTWRSLTLPHDWSIELNFDSKISTGVGALKGGTGWYRKHFVLPKEYTGKRIQIDFDGVYQDSYLWVNGQLVGNYPNGYVPFSFDITNYLVCDAKTENVVVVKATNVTNENSAGYTSRWYSGSGIYRNVHITMTEPVHLEQYGTVIKTPNIKTEYSSGNVTTDLTTTIKNESSADASVSVKNTILDYNSGITIGGAQPAVSDSQVIEAGGKVDISQQILVSNPKLWTLKSPNLYKMKTEVLVNGIVVDTYETRFGFNWCDFDSNTGFSLNGESMKIEGVCLHHDQGALGAVANTAAITRQIRIMKEMGINAIRTSHNAADPELMRICDESGIMVFEESFDSWWMGKNEKDYGKQFFSQKCTYPGVEEGTTWAKFDLQQIIKKDRNCPSIIMWGLGNECTETTYSEAISYITQMMKWVKEVDTEHVATMAENKYKLSWSNPSIMKQVDDKLDIVGLNYGEAYYDSLHKSKPAWKIFGSETASTLSSRGYYATPWFSGNKAVDNVDGNLAGDAVSGQQLSSYDNRSARFGRSATEALIYDRDREFFGGQFIWTGFDYIGEPTPFDGTAKSSYFGIVDTAGFPKDNYYLYQSQWLTVDEKPMVHLLPHWNWENDTLRTKVTYPAKSTLSKLAPAELTNYSDSDVGKIPMRIYSNAPAVELFVDGVSQGKKEFAQKVTSYGKKYQQQSEDSDRLYLEWPLIWSYKVGTKIEAVAYDLNGKEIARDQVVTAGDPAKLNATTNRTEIAADGLDLSYISVDVQDSTENFAPTAMNKINFSVEGDGEIVGVDNGDPVSRERYKDTNGTWSRKAFNGKALVIVRSTKQAGSFTVTASSQSLESSSVTVTTKEIKVDNEIVPTATPISTPVVVSPTPVVPTSTPNPIDQKIKNGQKFSKGSLNYKVLSASKKTVTVTSAIKKTTKKITIPATVTWQGTTLKVTAIADNAFKGYKKLNTIVIGKNMKEIGKSCLYQCSNLTQIDIKSVYITKIKSKAFSKINKKAAISVPKKKAVAYKKLFKQSGLPTGYTLKKK